MLFKYPASVRRGLTDRMRRGEAVLAFQAESEICLGTLHRWKHQALVDAGLTRGRRVLLPRTFNLLRKRIRPFEDELAIVKAASAL
ncbi:transposase [bacterium RCC_150]